MSQTQFDIFIEEDHYQVSVSHDDIAAAQPLFKKMDADMDIGWRMGPEFVTDPDIMQRSQIVAERLMLAIESQNEAMQTAMAAYIVWRFPNVREVHVDTTGEPLLTEIITH